MDKLEVLAENLRALRARRNVRQSDVARAIGSTTASISNYENAQREPTLHTAAKLADYYGVTIEYLRTAN